MGIPYHQVEKFFQTRSYPLALSSFVARAKAIAAQCVSIVLSLSATVPNPAPNRVADLRYQNVSDYDHIAL
jgi:hypothetical protein